MEFHKLNFGLYTFKVLLQSIVLLAVPSVCVCQVNLLVSKIYLPYSYMVFIFRGMVTSIPQMPDFIFMYGLSI